MANPISLKLSDFKSWLNEDARHFQIISQVFFLYYGIFNLGWDADWINFVSVFAGALLIQVIVIKFASIPMHSLKSAIITSLGLSLLLKTNSPALFFIAGTLAIGQKFAFKMNGKHLWNPANFAIIILVLFSDNAWVSPGQWGSSAILVLLIAVAGLNVISRVNRVETGLAFILSLAILEYGRTILYLGWGHEVWLHKLSSGSLWLFAFFMITDPMTSPNNKKARLIWAVCIAVVSFILTSFYFINAAPQWVLFALTPFTILIDKVIKGEAFNWLKKKEMIQPLNTQVQ